MMNKPQNWIELNRVKLYYKTFIETLYSNLNFKLHYRVMSNQTFYYVESY